MAFSQRDIEPILVYSDTSNFEFTGEWQYLSTDIYLFNGENFGNLINELDFSKTKPSKRALRRKGLEEERLEYLLITANLKNVKFFGGNDITYPLYNFQISKDKESKYQTFVSDNIESIRIIDNLPLYSASNFIDAEIKVRAITNNDRDQMLSLVASQLKNISKILNPSEALLSIIGEFGNFIEANTRKKEYRFSSTIRLFEQKNFDTRIHSIKVYALSTANSKTAEIDPQSLSNYLDTLNHSTVNKLTLKKLISHTEYPLVVVVNYKSLYDMVEVTGDEVNFANIEKRKFKIESDFRAGLINADTYRQEKDYISFLTVFANLKSNLEVYSLSYKTGNTDALSSSLFRMLQYYRQLIKTFDEIKYKYKGNTTYLNVFKKEYESILGYASLYLDDDHNLKQLKNLVKTLIELEANPKVEQTLLESVISSLRFSDMFKTDMMIQSQEGQLISNHLKRLEEQYYQSVFENDIKRLSSIDPQTDITSLKQRIRNTPCGVCRSRGFDAIKEYELLFSEHLRKRELSKVDSLSKILKPWLFDQIQLIHLIKSNFTVLFPTSNNSDGCAYLQELVAAAERDVINIKDFLNIDISEKDISIIKNLFDKLQALKGKVDESLTSICKLKPTLCSSSVENDTVKVEQADIAK
ncbi:MAG TPA: hypothetical protein DIW31_06470 [Bacteroidales bacterium]|nr:hypothetical protein [Bacteroidales bacterium]